MDNQFKPRGVRCFIVSVFVIILLFVSLGCDSSPSHPGDEPGETSATIPPEGPLPPYPSGYGCIAQESSESFTDAGYWDCIEALVPIEQEQLAGIWFDAFGYPNVDQYGRDWYTPGDTQLWWDDEKACGLHWRLGYPSAAELRGQNFPADYQVANSEWSVGDANDERAYFLFVRHSFLSPEIRKARCEDIFGEGAFIDLFLPTEEYWVLVEQKNQQAERETTLIDQLNRAMDACPSYQWRFLELVSDGRERLAYRTSRESEEAEHSGGIAAKLQVLTVYNDGIEEDILRVENTCGLR